MGFFSTNAIASLQDVNDVQDYAPQWVSRAYTPGAVPDFVTADQMFNASPSLVSGDGAPVGDVGGQAVEVGQFYFDYTNEELYLITTFEVIPPEVEGDPFTYNIIWTLQPSLIVLPDNTVPAVEDGVLGDFCIVKLGIDPPATAKYTLYGEKYFGPEPYRALAFFPPWWLNDPYYANWRPSSLADIKAASTADVATKLSNSGGEYSKIAYPVAVDGTYTIFVGDGNVFFLDLDDDYNVELVGFNGAQYDYERKFTFIVRNVNAGAKLLTWLNPVWWPDGNPVPQVSANGGDEMILTITTRNNGVWFQGRVEARYLD